MAEIANSSYKGFGIFEVRYSEFCLCEESVTNVGDTIGVYTWSSCYMMRAVCIVCEG